MAFNFRSNKSPSKRNKVSRWAARFRGQKRSIKRSEGDKNPLISKKAIELDKSLQKLGPPTPAAQTHNHSVEKDISHAKVDALEEKGNVIMGHHRITIAPSGDMHPPGASSQEINLIIEVDSLQEHGMVNQTPTTIQAQRPSPENDPTSHKGKPLTEEIELVRKAEPSGKSKLRVAILKPILERDASEEAKPRTQETASHITTHETRQPSNEKSSRSRGTITRSEQAPMPVAELVQPLRSSKVAGTKRDAPEERVDVNPPGNSPGTNLDPDAPAAKSGSLKGDLSLQRTKSCDEGDESSEDDSREATVYSDDSSITFSYYTGATFDDDTTWATYTTGYSEVSEQDTYPYYRSNARKKSSRGESSFSWHTIANCGWGRS